MSKMRERVIGASVTVVVAGAAFWAGAAANADEALPAEPTEATIASLTARLDAVEDTLASHGARLTVAEGNINNVEPEIGLIWNDLNNLSNWVSALENP